MSKKEITLAEAQKNPANAELITETPAPLCGNAPEPGLEATDGTPAPAESAPPTLPPEQIEELRAKAARAEDYWDRLVRSTADLENFKKRAARERQEAVKFANESLLEKLVPVLDSFDMAVAAATSSQNSSVDSIRTGITMIHSQLRAVAAEAGLEEIDATAKRFDANWHEAVSHQESAAVEEGQVLQQLRKGYKLRDRLIRAATVVVAKKPCA